MYVQQITVNNSAIDPECWLEVFVPLQFLKFIYLIYGVQLLPLLLRFEFIVLREIQYRTL